MSVKFEKETIRDAPIPGGFPGGLRDSLRGRPHDIAHAVGEKITGGETATGYLAVTMSSFAEPIDTVLKTFIAGIPPAT